MRELILREKHPDIPLPFYARGTGVNRYSTAGSQGITMFEASDKKQESWEFMKWWMSTPTQEAFIQKMNSMSFARYIYPENEEEILHDIRHALGVGRTTRLSKSKPVPLDQLQSRQTGR